MILKNGVLINVKQLCMFFPVTKGLILERKIGEVKAVNEVSFSIQKG